MCHIKIILKTVIGILFFVVTVLHGQQKQNDHYNENNWYNTFLIKASNNGQWAHFTNSYLDGRGVACVKNLKTHDTFSFADGYWGNFSNNNEWFAIHSESNSLIVASLNEGLTDTIQNVKINYFSYDGRHLIIQSTEDSLSFIALDSKKVYNAGKSRIIEMNPIKAIIAAVIVYDNKEALHLYDIKTSKSLEILGEENIRFEKLAWNVTGDKLAFLYSSDQEKTYNLGLFDLKTHQTQFLSAEEYLLKKGVSIANVQLSISDVGDRVFFYVSPDTEEAKEPEGVEIWDTFETSFYPRRNFFSSGKLGPWLTVWYPHNGKIIPLGSKEMPQVVFNANTDYALNFDALAREPQFRSNTFVDVYTINLNNGTKEFVLANQYIGLNFIHFSPNGKYLTYFKKYDWWLYDIQKRKHINLTKDLPTDFYNSKSPSTTTPDPYGLAGWTSNDAALFLYDEYDVWKISTDGLKKEKITKGRNDMTLFRIVKRANDNMTNYGSTGFNTYSIDDRNGLLLSAKNQKNLQMGFYHWTSKNSMRQITWKDKRLSQLLQVDQDSFLFEEQSFTQPKSIELTNLKTKLSNTIFQSNSEWDKFKWPQRKLIEYNTEIADSLKGVLIYPLNYDPTKKYPMVVHVYEEQSSNYHRFTPPTNYNETGFNFMNYALDGYFVLLPDIEFKNNAPGISATVCVEKAVKKAIEAATIDEKRIGLIGHSLGGYEAAFIVTQSDMFATAVSGCGIHNLVSYYFDIYKTQGYSEMARVEQSIFRMDNSYFENPDAYLANSPLQHAKNINTPLFIWAGKEDSNVNPSQSLQGFLALRRLRKPGMLYYYENEGHILNKNTNKLDLSKRIKKWFDSYLK
ncbi:alpha/beta hydrolase family protein [Aequorivita capsosiphonis]|uniref:alpha/beta hydrolase family protein n=1 Tax=Aequorivita capsosiphonis TaxID=487317 RepID=UPI0003FC35E3|nr:prolyl oligopeptidase family serine peptidase [Aequorivita capsosiphonis]